VAANPNLGCLVGGVLRVEFIFDLGAESGGVNSTWFLGNIEFILNQANSGRIKLKCSFGPNFEFIHLGTKQLSNPAKSVDANEIADRALSWGVEWFGKRLRIKQNLQVGFQYILGHQN
jgi:hypothetical protein